MPNEVNEVHVSGINTFLTCRRKWFLGDKSQHNLEPKYPQDALWLGTGVHLGLEAFVGSMIRELTYEQATENMTGVFAAWADEEVRQIEIDSLGLMPEQAASLKESRSLGYGMLQHYGDCVEEMDREAEVQYHEVELDFCISLGEDFNLCGRMDGLMTAQRRLWVSENKTAASIVAVTPSLELDHQAGAYLLAAREVVDGDIAGVMYNYLRKKLPVWPETLQRGGLTKRANIDTTFAVYLSAIQDAGLDYNNYIDILTALKEKGNTFFQRLPIQRTVAETTELRERFLKIAQEMRRGVQESILYPSPSLFNCRGCSFPPVCRAIAQQADYRYILDTHYRVRTESRAQIDWDEE